MDSNLPLLKVVTLGSNYWTIITRVGDTIHIEGVLADLLSTMAKALHVRFEVILPPDGQWGKPEKNGSWNGMIGVVHREVAEFALGPFSITPQRNEVVDYSAVYYHSSEVILTPRPSAEKDIGGFLKPFTVDVWLLVLFSLAATTISLFLMEILEEKLFHFKTDNIFAKSLMWAVKAVTQEGSEWLPSKDGGRVIVMVWLLASMVFMSSYSGILTAMLTAPRVPITINSLHDLVSQTDSPWRFDTPLLYNYFKDSSDLTQREAYAKSSGLFTSCWTDKEMIVSGRYTGICSYASVEKIFSWEFSTSGKCRTYKARDPVLANDIIALPFQRNSIYLENANRVVLSLLESGIFNKWISNRLLNATHCMKPPSADESSDDSNSALDIVAMGGPFLLLLGGYALTILAFVGEMAVYSTRKFNNEKVF